VTPTVTPDFRGEIARGDNLVFEGIDCSY
jgi:hypothetical protein